MGSGEPWYRFALCTDGREFYDFPQNEEQEIKSKRVCLSCPVRLECLAHSFTFQQNDGIWGGLTEKQRKGFAAMIGLPTSASEVVILSLLVRHSNGQQT